MASLSPVKGHGGGFLSRTQQWVKKMRTASSVVQGEISIGVRLFDMKKELGMESKEDEEAEMETIAGLKEKMMRNHTQQRVSKPYKPKSFGTWLYLEIESCRDLGKADRFGQSDPFVVIKVGDIELARTEVIPDEGNPDWYTECYELPNSHFDFNKIEIKLECWDMDLAEVGSFLGCAFFDKSDFTFSDSIVTVTKPLIRDKYRPDNNGVPKMPKARAETSFFQRMASHKDPEGLGFVGLRKIQSKGEDEMDASEGLVMSPSPDKKEKKKSNAGGEKTWHRLKTKVEKHGKEMGSYKVPNPEPTRRNQKSRLKYDNVKNSKKTLFIALGIILTYLLVGMVSFSYIFERWTLIDSLYFSVVTFTTVGYGDLFPGKDYTNPHTGEEFAAKEPDEKVASQMFCSFFSLLGIAIIGYALQILGQQFVQAQMSAMEKAANNQKPVDIMGSAGGLEFAYGDSEEIKEQKMIKAAMVAKEKEVKKKHDDIIERRKAILKILIPIISLFVFGALIFGAIEEWSFAEALYWCIITAASIGYGEYSPAKQVSRGLMIIFIPLSVGIIGQGLAGIVNIFIEEEIKKANLKLMGRELTIEDLDSMNTDDDGEVSELEFVEFMLKTMKKVDQALLNDLHSQFKKMDADGSGSLQKSDLELLAKRKLAVRRKLTLAAYKADLTTKARRATAAAGLSAIAEDVQKSAKISPEA